MPILNLDILYRSGYDLRNRHTLSKVAELRTYGIQNEFFRDLYPTCMTMHARSAIGLKYELRYPHTFRSMQILNYEQLYRMPICNSGKTDLIWKLSYDCSFEILPLLM